MCVSRILLASLIALGVGCQAHAEDCDSTQAAMNQCASKAYADLDAELNRLYKQQMDWLHTPAKKQALKNAQRKWLAYRDAECKYRAGDRKEGGSMWPMVQAGCLADHTRVRVEQLKADVACRTDGCVR